MRKVERNSERVKEVEMGVWVGGRVRERERKRERDRESDRERERERGSREGEAEGGGERVGKSKRDKGGTGICCKTAPGAKTALAVFFQRNAMHQPRPDRVARCVVRMGIQVSHTHTNTHNNNNNNNNNNPHTNEERLLKNSNILASGLGDCGSFFSWKSRQACSLSA